MSAGDRGVRRRAEALLGVAASVILLAMMLLTVVDVVARYVFNRPVRGAFEVTELMLVVLIFAGLPLVSYAEGHAVMDFVDRFLGARVELDAAVLTALATDCDPQIVLAHLETIERIAAGDAAAGPIAALSMAERFHWLVAPSSTIIQPSEVHTGLTDDPASTLEHLFRTLVRR